MRKLVLFLSIILFVGLQTLSAQTKAISGKVIDDLGEAIPGVSIMVKGTTMGTVTRPDGTYNLNVPGDATAILFTFVGMEMQEVPFTGQSTINVTMTSDTEDLDEVVVTAVGIKRAKRSLGYAVSTVESESLTDARDANVVNSLAGKVAGVQITQQSGSLGGGSKILIRGASSMAGGNDPLFVIDGVPVSNSSYNGTRNEIISGGVDVGNKASDLNPDDIESISVLKGAAATALYGSRAKDGALIITTKKGKKGAKKISVSINSSFRMDNVLKLPDFQNEYGPGSYGEYKLESQNGWGPKISEVADQKFENFLGEEVQLKAYPDNVKDFYDTGYSYINSVAFSGGGDDGDFRVGYTNLYQTGVVPESELKRNSLSFNSGRELSDKLKARATFNYVKTQIDGKPAQGSNNPNVLASMVNGMPRTMDVKLLEDNVYDEDGQYISPNSKNANNPYWVAKNNKFTQDMNRFYGSFTLNYEPIENLIITERAGGDVYFDNRRQVTRKGTFGALTGSFFDRNLQGKDFNNDITISYSKDDLIDGLNLTTLIGHNVNQRTFDEVTVDNNDLIIDELYNYTNAESTTTTNYTEKRRLTGLYYDVSLSYNNYLFFNLTGRNDWSSTLPKNNNSYFYPSISLGFVFSELLPTNEILSYGKIRGNFANVGSDEDPYQLDFQYYPDEEYFNQYVSSGTYPHGGVLAFTGPSTIPPGNTLKPQNQKSWEVGAELKFINDRIGLDFTYYNTVTEDQILSVPISPTSGFNYKKVNAGSVSNKGFEVMLTGTPIAQPNGFRWDFSLNFSANKNTVEKLASGVDELSLTSGWSGLVIKAIPGKTFGMYGTGFKRDDAGNYVISDQTGLRVVEDNVRLGDIYPEWTLGIRNEFSYKGISLSGLIDIRQGGVIYSNTVADLRYSGLAKETLVNRDKTFIDIGVNEVEGSDGEITYVENATPVRGIQDFWQGHSLTSTAESNTFDASYVKLREIVLSYQLPNSLISKTPFGSIVVGAEARNVWIIKDHVPHIDPEVNFFGSSLTGDGVEFGSVPSVRSVGFNLKCTF